jgi:hypothetical protein
MQIAKTGICHLHTYANCTYIHTHMHACTSTHMQQKRNFRQALTETAGSKVGIYHLQTYTTCTYKPLFMHVCTCSKKRKAGSHRDRWFKGGEQEGEDGHDEDQDDEDGDEAKMLDTGALDICVCVCVCVYTCMRENAKEVHIQVHIYTCTYIYLHTYARTYTYIQAHLTLRRHGRGLRTLRGRMPIKIEKKKMTKTLLGLTCRVWRYVPFLNVHVCICMCVYTHVCMLSIEMATMTF